MKPEKIVAVLILYVGIYKNHIYDYQKISGGGSLVV